MTEPKYTTQTPFLAGFAILRKENKIAFVLRSNTGWMNGYYGLPSGKIEQNENFSMGALREGGEEVGITIQKKDLKFAHVMHRQSEDGTQWVDVFFEAASWSGEPYNAEPDVHSELAWLDPQNLPHNVIPPVKFALEQIEAGNPYSEYGWQDLK